MIRKRYVGFALFGVAICMLIAAAFYLQSTMHTDELLSAADAKILRSDTYYLQYTTQWLLGQEEIVEMEEAYNGISYFQRYEAQGAPLISVTRDKTVKAFDPSGLLLEQENTLPYVSPYAKLQYNGQYGAITLDGNALYYEEYDLPQGDTMHWLRFLYLDNELWGLQIDRPDRYVKVLTLGKDIPLDLLAYSSHSSDDITADVPDTSTPSDDITADVPHASAPTIDYPTELTIQVVAPDKSPVAGIGVYANPPATWYLCSSPSYAVTNNNGFAVLPNMDSEIKEDATITIGLADRNQSARAQQIVEVPVQKDAHTPVQITWEGILPQKAIDDSPTKLTITIVDSHGQPMADMWVSLRPAGEPTVGSANNDMGAESDLLYDDWHKPTSVDGRVSFVGIAKDTYAVHINGGKGQFNLGPSDNPAIPREYIYPLYPSPHCNTVDYTADEAQEATVTFIPSKIAQKTQGER